MSTELAALNRFNRLASQGAQQTAAALERLLDQTTRAPVTDVRLTQRSTLARRFDQDEFVGVQAGFDGCVDGTAVIAMSSADVEAIAASLGADDDLIESGLESVGNIAASGFIDVIANAAGSTITLEPPRLVTGAEEQLVPAGPVDSDWILTITSEFELIDRVLELAVVLVPDSSSVLRAVETDDHTPVIDRVTTIGELTQEGAANAAEHVEMMTGLDATVSISRIRFAPVESMMAVTPADTAVGTVFKLESVPNGYFALLFDEPAAIRVAEAMIPGGLDEDPTWEAMGQSAISELGNIVTSGFIDGWANAMDGTIPHSPPSFVADDRRAIVSSLVSNLASEDAAGVVADAEVTVDNGSIACTLHTLPTRDGLDAALQRINPH